MINTNHLLRVAAWWTSIVYIVCFVGVALFPSVRTAFVLYGLHTTVELGESIMTITTFISGLIIWNVIAFLAVGLFAVLFNRIKA